jgi:hypothetical protein
MMWRKASRWSLLQETKKKQKKNKGEKKKIEKYFFRFRIIVSKINKHQIKENRIIIVLGGPHNF